LLVEPGWLVCGWDCATANVHDTTFHSLIQTFEEQMIVLADYDFYSKEVNPKNLKVCQPKSWNARMLIETLLSMLTMVFHFKHLAHRVWEYFKARLAFTMAAFNILVQWHGLNLIKIALFTFLSLSLVCKPVPSVI
jgi:hypothetical protein